MRCLLYIIALTLSLNQMQGQNEMQIKAHVDVETKSISINHRITYNNTTNDTLKTIYLNDWNNSYSTKTTPLAKRFEEEFSTKFHLAKNKQRGFTTVTAIKDHHEDHLTFSRLKEHPDVIKINLQQALMPFASYTIDLTYTLVIPDATFTDYGFTDQKNFKLKHWYITPAVYDGKWHYYSNKNLNDLYVPKSNIHLEITHPREYRVISSLDVKKYQATETEQTTILEGKNRIDTYISISKFPKFNYVQTDDLFILSDIDPEGLNNGTKALITDKIIRFLHANLGEYPHEQLLITESDYNRSPLYGINQLPAFLRPFPDDFQFELKLLKTATKQYLDNVLLTHPRNDYWLSEGIQIYLMMKYVERYYPDVKLFGSLANIWGLRAFHGADLKFNFQYFLYFMEIARRNRDQALTTPKDSLIKFNANIAGQYKAGLGLNYLDNYINDAEFAEIIKAFISKYKLQAVSSEDFKNFLEQNTKKDIDWFFNDYITNRGKIDFKIKSITETKDSLEILIKNKHNTNLPLPIYRIENDSVIDKTWMKPFTGTQSITLPKDSTEMVVIDHETMIPEFNQRDNYRLIKKPFLNNKPLQIRLFKDIEDPYYDQVFIMPLIEFRNIYDGLTLGAKFYNKTILRKRLNYRFSPQYGTRSRSLTGSASVFYTHNLENQNLFDITYGMSASYQSFAQDAFVTSIRPSVSFTFRKDKDFRADQRDLILARLVSIQRSVGENAVVEIDEPDYNVFNLRYVHSNPGLINFENFTTDFQIAKNFSKLALTYEFRKLTKGNRNVNLRLFAGTFLTNNTDPNSNYFSFALDRPTDYLFDLNYLGRSEASGIYSQQIIIAEGGFKSKLDPAFANQWMATANFSTSIWRYIQAYTDFGLVKNRFSTPKFVFDSGIRLNLVEDYFEVFFPIYSDLGWEIAQSNYDQRIRLMFTFDPQILLKLFTRKWY